MSKRIVAFKSPRGHYKAHACVVWCFDHRFRKLFHALVRQRKYRHVDRVVVAGGAKSLASPKHESHRAYVLDQIEASIALHNAPLVILMTHSDCGAYGGLKSFGGSESAEMKKHRAELRRAASFVKQHLPRGVRVETVFANFEGLHSL